MSSIENKIETICSKLDNLSAEIKSKNLNLFEFMKKTETSLKLNEQQLQIIKINIEAYSNKLAEVEKSQTFISSQYETQNAMILYSDGSCQIAIKFRQTERSSLQTKVSPSTILPTLRKIEIIHQNYGKESEI